MVKSLKLIFKNPRQYLDCNEGFLFKIIINFTTMISVYNDIWLRIKDYGSKYMSGLDVVGNFNTRLAETQREVYNDLSVYYQTNEKVRGILAPWLVKDTGTASSAGEIILPTGADRVISMAVVQGTTILYEINPITESELVMANRIPQRKPDSSKKRAYYYAEDSLLISLAPAEALTYLVFYLIFPTPAQIAFTYTQSADEDVMTLDTGATIDLEWSQNASNIILYKMLEKYGITTRESWLAEYARIGVNVTMTEALGK